MRRPPIVLFSAAVVAILGAAYLAAARTAPIAASVEPGGPSKANSARGSLPTTVAVPVGSRTVWVDANEVTVGAFGACVAAGACSMEHVTVIADSTCNYEAKGRESHPMNCVAWYGAEQVCRYAGARLCTAEEWLSGCRGPLDQDYPYGPTYDPAACNAATNVGPVAVSSSMPVGSNPACNGGYPGLRDMVGNVTEWLDECKDDYCKFYGGAFTTNEPIADFASCKPICGGNKKAFRSSTIGVRCCHDTPPPSL